jgi:hypothetical protein
VVALLAALCAAAALGALRRRRAKVAARGPWAPVPLRAPLSAPLPSARTPPAPARAPLRAPAPAARQGAAALGALVVGPTPGAPPRALAPLRRPEPLRPPASGGGPPPPAPARPVPHPAPLARPAPRAPPGGDPSLLSPRPPAPCAPPAPLHARPALPLPRLPRRADGVGFGALPRSDLTFIVGALECGFVEVEERVPPLALSFDEEKLPGFAGSASVSARLRVKPHPVPRTGGAAGAWARGAARHGKAVGVAMPGCRGARMLAAARCVEDEWARRSLRGGFAVLGARVDTPCASLPVLADELPVTPYARRDEPVWVRNWAPAATGPHFLLAKITELTIGGHSDIVRVRLDGSTDKSGLVDVHRSRMVLQDPKKKDVRGSRARPPAGLEVVKVAPAGADGETWKVAWRGGATTVEGAGVVWHFSGSDGRPLADAVLGVPWGHKA